MKPPKPAPIRQVKTIDPFEYWPRAESRIGGLGGTMVPPDPAYVFHSAYVEIGSGVVVCSLRFERLEATMGMLNITVIGRAPDPEAQPEPVRSWTADLRDVAEGDGVLELSFQASAGSRYAVVGHVYEECDARARALTGEFQLTPDASAAEGKVAVRKSLFGRRVFRRTAKMVVRVRPTLADPVSQPCTPAQLTEPTFARWAGAIGHTAADPRDQWGEVFILQALERYGVMRPGARGLGFGVRTSVLPAFLAARGCTIMASDAPPAPVEGARRTPAPTAASLERLRHPEICADDVFDRQVDFTAIDPARIDGRVNGYDFAWSMNLIEHAGSIDAGLGFVRDAVNTLTFGGLAVHVMVFNSQSPFDTVDEAATVLARRQDLERMAVDLVSRGHYVAQLNFELGSPPLDPIDGASLAPADPELAAALDEHAPIPFGLIVRRGDR